MTRDQSVSPGAQAVLLVVAWLLVGLPLAWGTFNTAMNAMQLFR